MPINEEYLTAGAAAKILNLSSESVRLYERRGLLPAIKASGGLRLFREADIRKFAEERRAKMRTKKNTEMPAG
jgi:DNA-binding transcriptional MerR regulator